MPKIYCLLLAFAILPLLFSQKAHQKIKQMYQESCSNCHLVPDLKYRNDKIWFKQVLVTA